MLTPKIKDAINLKSFSLIKDFLALDEELQLIDKLIQDKIIDERPDQIIVNEYQPGKRLKPHLIENAILKISLLVLA